MRPSLARRLLRSLYGSLVAYGTLYTGGEPRTANTPSPAAPPPPAPLRGLTGPARSHPERVRPDIPLTPLELALQRELRSR
ncbi:DUF6059 family protein [Streptomyces sp. NBC_01408]|uniref:DUF6059 family protein n=1 Tax=Streptomyces sp. NBC_01408 TaxID=2903855 RepID=UPI00224E19E1|nr:DUF6059 family protein [Streptomyces sp. NBC_01408]MCX4696858.1 hypothetical protein [Streptomyces sp. NBC_01408]